MKIDIDLSGVKIPKKVAGVKVPKQLRKTGKKLLAKAQSDAGREAIAAGLTIAGVAIAAKARAKAERTAAAAQAAGTGDDPAAGKPGAPGIDSAHDPSTQLAQAITGGLETLQRLLGARVAK